MLPLHLLSRHIFPLLSGHDLWALSLTSRHNQSIVFDGVSPAQWTRYYSNFFGMNDSGVIYYENEVYSKGYEGGSRFAAMPKEMRRFVLRSVLHARGLRVLKRLPENSSANTDCPALVAIEGKEDSDLYARLRGWESKSNAESQSFKFDDWVIEREDPAIQCVLELTQPRPGPENEPEPEIEPQMLQNGCVYISEDEHECFKWYPHAHEAWNVEHRVDRSMSSNAAAYVNGEGRDIVPEHGTEWRIRVKGWWGAGGGVDSNDKCVLRLVGPSLLAVAEKYMAKHIGAVLVPLGVKAKKRRSGKGGRGWA